MKLRRKTPTSPIQTSEANSAMSRAREPTSGRPHDARTERHCPFGEQFVRLEMAASLNCELARRLIPVVWAIAEDVVCMPHLDHCNLPIDRVALSVHRQMNDTIR